MRFSRAFTLLFLCLWFVGQVRAEWVLRRAADGTQLNAIARGRDRFVAVGAAGLVFTSTTGARWERLGPFTDKDLLGITSDGNGFWAVAPDAVFVSEDGLVWQENPNTSGRLFLDVGYGAGKFLLTTDVFHEGGDGRGYMEKAILLTSDWTSWDVMWFSGWWGTTRFGRIKSDHHYVGVPVLYDDDMSQVTHILRWDGANFWQEVVHSDGWSYGPQAADFTLPVRAEDLRMAMLSPTSGTPLVYHDWHVRQAQVYHDCFPNSGYTLIESEDFSSASFLLFAGNSLIEMGVGGEPSFGGGANEIGYVSASCNEQPIPEGNWRRIARWRGASEFSPVLSRVVLGEGGAIIQPIDYGLSFVQPPASRGNGRVSLTINLPPAMAVELLKSADLREWTIEQTFPAGVGAIEQVDISVSGNAFFFLRGVRTGQ